MNELESATIISPTPELTPLPEAYWEETPYFKIASRQISRGLAVAPVHPNEKHGVLWNQYSHPATTLSEVIQHAKDFPNYNVAISSHRGVGKLFFWDVDSAGVIEQVETETCKLIPTTFTVQSRPESAPYKQHRYFLSTPYSFAKFGGWKSKEVNVKDLNSTVEGKHPTKYDLKGIGRGGYVVSEGSRHPNGEIYTIMDDTNPIGAPDWLIDWFITDIGKYRHDAAVEREQNKKVEASQSNDPNGVPDPSDALKVMPNKTDAFLKSRCGDLAIRGTRRGDIVLILKHQLQDHTSLSKEEQKRYYHRIHDLAFDPNLKIGLGVAWSSLWEKNHTSILGTTTTTVKPNGGMTMEYNSQQHLITKELRRFPDEIPVAEGYARLNATLGLNLTSKNSRQNATLRAARKAAGLVAENRKGCWWWVRQSERQSVKSDQAASQPSADQPTVGGGNHHSRLVNQPSITHTPHTPLYTVNVVGDGNQ